MPLADMMPKGEDWIPRELADIRRQIRELGPSIAESFAPVIADLQEQQAALAAQQATLADLVSRVVVPAAFSASGTSFATADYAWETKASTSITVPAGFTKAVVNANAFLRVTNTQPDIVGFTMVRPAIGGATGDDEYTKNIGPSERATSGSSMSRLMTGLTPGGTFVVSCQVATSSPWGATSDNLARVSGTIQWFR